MLTVNRAQPSNPLYEGPTIRGLIKSLALGFVHSLRENKLAAVFAALACLGVTFLAIMIQYDERPDYRATILPAIEQAEGEFLTAVELANGTADESWRLQYFLLAHGKIKEILRLAQDRLPRTAEARQAHTELIRYYSLANEGFAIIRTELSLHQELDYLAEWKRQQVVLQPIRQRWLDWLNGDS